MLLQWGTGSSPAISGNTIGGTTAGARNVISGNSTEGVFITGSARAANVVEGNYVGTDPGGTQPLGNSAVGVLITGGATGNTVGGTAADAGNVVSNNGSVQFFLGGVYLTGSGTSGNVVAGNLIGTDKSGTHALGNNWDGVGIEGGASGNTVGGTTAAARNVISGNVAVGVEIDGPGSSANVIAGNYIGTDVNGTGALGNAQGGVLFRVDPTDNTVGGATAARNVISANGGDGVLIGDSGTSGNVVEANYIGVDATGTHALGNGGNGVTVSAPGNTVGGIGAGALSNVATLATGTGAFVPIKSVVGDFNSDGKLDVVTVLHSGSGDELSVSLGNGDGTFQPPIETNVTGKFNVSPADLVAVDLDGDGKLDLVGASTLGAGSTFLTVFMGNGNGTFQTGTQVSATSAGGQTDAVEVGDFNKDGRPDLVVADHVNNQIDVLLNFGAGSFTRVPVLTVSPPRLLSVADFNGDSYPDVAAVATNNSVYLFLGDGNGNFSGTGSALNGGPGATAMGVGDFDGDGKLDLAVGHADGSVRLFPQPGSFSFLSPIDVQAGTDVQDMAVGDFDGNGHEDIAVTNQATGTVTYLLGQGNFVFNPPASVAFGNNGTDQLSAADLNGDGLTDLIGPSGVMGALAKNSVTLLRSGGSNVISGNTGIGINITGPLATGNMVEGNYVGTNANGAAALANSTGVEMDTGAANNTIGGGSAAARNVISGNTNNGVQISGSGTNANVVAGNYIGTNVAGAAAVPNGAEGVLIVLGAQANIIGTNGDGVNDANEGNVISGNHFHGIIISDEPDTVSVGAIHTSNNIIAGNFIGTNSVGTGAIPNPGDGIFIAAGASGNRIGSNADGVSDSLERNIISGNLGSGIAISGASANNNVVAGNFVGVSVTGNAPLGNLNFGVSVAGGAVGNRIGTDGNGVNDFAERNVIGENPFNGVFIGTSTTSGNLVAGNSIGVGRERRRRPWQLGRNPQRRSQRRRHRPVRLEQHHRRQLGKFR